MGLFRNVTATRSGVQPALQHNAAAPGDPRTGEQPRLGAQGCSPRSISEPRGSAEAWKFLLQLSQGPRELRLRLSL